MLKNDGIIKFSNEIEKSILNCQNIVKDTFAIMSGYFAHTHETNDHLSRAITATESNFCLLTADIFYEMNLLISNLNNDEFETYSIDCESRCCSCYDTWEPDYIPVQRLKYTTHGLSKSFFYGRSSGFLEKHALIKNVLISEIGRKVLCVDVDKFLNFLFEGKLALPSTKCDAILDLARSHGRQFKRKSSNKKLYE